MKTLALLLLALALSAPAEGKKMFSPSKDDLAAYWDFEQDPSKVPPIWDRSHNQNHLQPNGFVVDVPGLTTGRVGNGLQLNGANQSLSLPAGSQNIGHQGNPFTVFFWYKPLTLSDGASIVSNNEWSVSTLESGSDIFFSVTIDGKVLVVTAVPLIAGRWYFVWVRFTGESIGASVNFTDGGGAGEARSSVSSSNSSFIIGGNGSHGIFDEMAIFRRSLSDREIQAIYNKGLGLALSEYDRQSCAKSITCCD